MAVFKSLNIKQFLVFGKKNGETLETILEYFRKFLSFPHVWLSEGWVEKEQATLLMNALVNKSLITVL